MDGDWIVFGVGLAIMIGMVMIVVIWLYCLDIPARRFQADPGYSACDSWADDDEDAFDVADDDCHSHGLRVNPASGLPMQDHVWLDVAGNPYGLDLHSTFPESSLDSFGSGGFGSGMGGMHDG